MELSALENCDEGRRLYSLLTPSESVLMPAVLSSDLPLHPARCAAARGHRSDVLACARVLRMTASIAAAHEHALTAKTLLPAFLPFEVRRHP